MQQGTNVASETLGRTVVQVIGHVRNGKAGVLEKPCSTNQSCHCQISLGRRDTGPEEPAHQRTGRHIEVTSKHPNIAEPRRAGKDGFEKLPAVVRDTCQVDCQLAQDTALSGIAGIRHECAAKFSPAGSLSNIDEAFDTTLPERQYRVWCPNLELTEKCDGWNTWEFSNE
jgi:hypothetical protein